MIPKQDRIQARTPEQLEREYNLGKTFKDANNSASKQATQIQNLTQSLVQFMALTQQRFTELEGNTQTWFGKGVPTLVNYPAVEWETDEDKANHIGDIYCNEDNGSLYLFKGANDVYEWVACQGTSTSEETETYYVAFYSGDGVVIASYLIRQGDAINPPVNEVAWKDSEGNVVTFPFTPTSDTNLTAVLLTTRIEIELTKKGDIVFSWYRDATTGGNYTKTNDGWCVVGYNTSVSGGIKYAHFTLVGKTQQSVAMSGSGIESGSLNYNNETYYYTIKKITTQFVTDYGKAVQLEETYTDNTTLATKLLDYYFMVD